MWEGGESGNPILVGKKYKSYKIQKKNNNKAYADGLI